MNISVSNLIDILFWLVETVCWKYLKKLRNTLHWLYYFTMSKITIIYIYETLVDAAIISQHHNMLIFSQLMQANSWNVHAVFHHGHRTTEMSHLGRRCYNIVQVLRQKTMVQMLCHFSSFQLHPTHTCIIYNTLHIEDIFSYSNTYIDIFFVTKLYLGLFQIFHVWVLESLKEAEAKSETWLLIT